MVYSHPLFKRDNPETLKQLRREKRPATEKQTKVDFSKIDAFIYQRKLTEDASDHVRLFEFLFTYKSHFGRSLNYFLKKLVLLLQGSYSVLYGKVEGAIDAIVGESSITSEAFLNKKICKNAISVIVNDIVEYVCKVDKFDLKEDRVDMVSRKKTENVLDLSDLRKIFKVAEERGDFLRPVPKSRLKRKEFVVQKPSSFCRGFVRIEPKLVCRTRVERR